MPVSANSLLFLFPKSPARATPRVFVTYALDVPSGISTIRVKALPVHIWRCRVSVCTLVMSLASLPRKTENLLR